MAKKINIGIIGAEEMRNNERKISREMELEKNDGSWVSKHKIHKSDKTYTRHEKHKGSKGF